MEGTIHSSKQGVPDSTPADGERLAIDRDREMSEIFSHLYYQL
jgi:hypothetical protein